MDEGKREKMMVKLLLETLPAYEDRLKKIDEEIEKLKKEREVVEAKIKEMRRDLEYFKRKGVV